MVSGVSRPSERPRSWRFSRRRVRTLSVIGISSMPSVKVRWSPSHSDQGRQSGVIMSRMGGKIRIRGWESRPSWRSVIPWPMGFGNNQRGMPGTPLPWAPRSLVT